MTALEKYDRLESSGVWRASPEEQRQNVTVSFGSATLMISDGAGRPLSHWSLPAIRRQKPYKNPATYCLSDDIDETLQLADPEMIDAIEKVRKALGKDQPRPGLIRWLSTAAFLTVISIIAVIWVPDAIMRQTLGAVPASKRLEIGLEIAQSYQNVTGKGCTAAQNHPVIAQLQKRLFGVDYQGHVMVVQHLPSGAVSLPGFVTLLDRYYLENFDDPAVPAGYLVAASTERYSQDPLQPVLEHIGFWASVELLTQGVISKSALQDYAQTLDDAQSLALNSFDLLNTFTQAKIPLFPYAQSQPNGFDMSLLADETLTSPPSLLSDQQWVTLQNICLL